MQIVILILEALIALPKIGEQVEKALISLTAWYEAKTKAEASQAIGNAELAAKAAKTQADRLAAAQKWQEALAKKRVQS
jgi:hypothetical protein